MGASFKENNRSILSSSQPFEGGLGFFYASMSRPIKIWARRIKPKSLRPCLCFPGGLRGDGGGIVDLKGLAASPFSFLSMYSLKNKGYR